MGEPLRRIVHELGLPDIVDSLANDIPGSDLTTLLLEVMRRRASRVTPAEVARRYEDDRFVRPGPSFLALRRIEDAFVAATEGFEWLTLAPVVPLATHAAMGYVDQNRLVSTIRGTEVAGDPTNGLALEAAVRRRKLLVGDPKSPHVVRLVGLQRALRAQRFEGAMSFPHFSILGLVSAGRDAGSGDFERAAVRTHLETYVRGLRTLGAERVRVVVSSWNPDVAIDEIDGAEVESDSERTAGYYRDVAFNVLATFDGHEVETGDGGAVDWSRRLCQSAKERMVVSGVGLDRLALVTASRAG